MMPGVSDVARFSPKETYLQYDGVTADINWPFESPDLVRKRNASCLT